jgi:hypothetical protein
VNDADRSLIDRLAETDVELTAWQAEIERAFKRRIDVPKVFNEGSGERFKTGILAAGRAAREEIGTAPERDSFALLDAFRARYLDAPDHERTAMREAMAGTSATRGANFECSACELTVRGVACLSQTPPAPDVEGPLALRRLADTGARIQVAEQHQFQPMNAGRIVIMAEYVEGGLDFCNLADAAHDHHLSVLADEAATTGEPRTLAAHLWLAG